MKRFKRFAVCTLSLAAFGAPVLVGTAPAHATNDSTNPVCVTDTASEDPGADACELNAGEKQLLDGNGEYGTNVLTNDLPEGATSVRVIGVDRLTPLFATMILHQESGKRNDYFGIQVEHHAPPVLQAGYTVLVSYPDGSYEVVHHTITIKVLRKPIPADPIVTLGKMKGNVRVCEPSTSDGGGTLTWAWGTYKPSRTLDGVRTLQPGHCITVCVTRHRINWEAWVPETGFAVAVGVLRHIPLSKRGCPMPLE